MTENQKLREAVFTVLEGCTLNHDVRKILEAAYYAPEALALPTAGKMINGLTQAETDASASVYGLTAAPVGERELPPLPSYARWEERIKTLMQQCGHPNSMSIYQAFKQFQNEFEHEMIAYARAALSADDHEQSKPSVEFDLGETSSHTVKCVWSEWDAKANKLVLCLSVRDIETAAPVGERDLPPVIAYRLDYPASEGVGLPRFFGADDGDRAHTFAFNHKATITELCDRAALSAGDAADAQRYRWLREQHWSNSDICCVNKPKQNVRLGGMCPSGDLLDAVIDAALRKGQL